MSSSLHLYIADNTREKLSNRNILLLLQMCCLKQRNWCSGDWNWNSDLSLSIVSDCRKHYSFFLFKVSMTKWIQRHHVNVPETVQSLLTVKFFRNVSLELSIQSLWFSLCLLDQHIVQVAKKNRKAFCCKDCIQT